ncbi:hypothetical protein FACS1894109_10930 [Spirochaetia bacterium]|nr:hypothetical protein FACS1894109_10930 [Spirochaetia bacterium]
MTKKEKAMEKCLKLAREANHKRFQPIRQHYKDFGKTKEELDVLQKEYAAIDEAGKLATKEAEELGISFEEQLAYNHKRIWGNDKPNNYV